MHPDCEGMSAHMRELGLGILAQAQKNAFYWDYDDILGRGVFSILQAAHASEILMKAAIAQEHPLLIFTQLPKSGSVDDGLLNISDLHRSGRTLQYFDLPERLWATTGYKLQCLEVFQQFGKLRNTIQHFDSPQNIDFSGQTAKFIYKVIDPLIGYFWNLYAVEYCAVDSHEDDMMRTLVRNGVLYFRCPERLETKAKEALSEVESSTT